MVDPITPKAVSTSDRLVASVTRITPGTAAAKVSDSGTDSASAPSTLTALAREQATVPPVDLDRVAKIRSAIADGTFPIYPAQIADRLIALKLEWNPNDASD